MSEDNQAGKTEDQVLEELRKEAEAAFTGQPLPPKEETKTEEPEAPENQAEKPSEPDQEPDNNPDGEPEQPQAADSSPAPEDKNEVPEKYRGKSPEELIKMLEDQHSYIGKLGSERTFERSEAEKLRRRLEAIEADLTSTKEKSQDAEFEAQLQDSDNPAHVVKEYIDKQFGSLNKTMTEDKLERQAKEAGVYLQELAKDPDFQRRQPQVDRIAENLAPYIKDEHVRSKAFIEVCDLISRGLDVDHYVQQAKADVSSQRESALKEKRESQVASASSTSSPKETSVEDMSLEELREEAIKAFAKVGK